MKTNKVLCCMFLFAFFAWSDPAQNTIVVYSVLRIKPIETCWLRNSCIVYELKTKGCARSWTFQPESWHLCLLLWCLLGFLTIPLYKRWLNTTSFAIAKLSSPQNTKNRPSAKLNSRKNFASHEVRISVIANTGHHDTFVWDELL